MHDQAETANQAGTISAGRCIEPAFFQPGLDKAVDRILFPASGFYLRPLRHRGLESPVVELDRFRLFLLRGHLRSLVYPRSQEANLPSRETLAAWRHDQLRIESGNQLHQVALGAVTPHQGGLA